MAKLKVLPMAVALGVTWGLGTMVLGWVSATGWGVRAVEVLSSAYIGFGSTFLGGVIGGLWGFVDAFLAGLILAPFYNLLAVGRHSEHLTIRAPSEQPAR